MMEPGDAGFHGLISETEGDTIPILALL